MGEKYRFENQATRSRNDIKLILELNKKLFFIKVEVLHVVKSEKLFAQKKERIVKVHDRAHSATFLNRPRTIEKVHPETGSAIAQPFGLQDFMEELASFTDG